MENKLTEKSKSSESVRSIENEIWNVLLSEPPRKTKRHFPTEIEESKTIERETYTEHDELAFQEPDELAFQEPDEIAFHEEE